MQKIKFRAGKVTAVVVAVLMMVSAFSLNAFAAGSKTLEEGTYTLDSSLSCYVNAMGGVEFAGGGFYEGATLNVDKSGNKTLTLNFGTGGFTIYGINAVTFLDPNPENPDTTRGVTPGTMGIYNQSGSIVTEGVTYTLSGDTTTAKNPSGSYVNYVSTMTVPLPHDSDTYNLTFYLNSQVMGMQFCNANSSATATPYPAVLTVDWDSAKKVKTADKTSTQSAKVKYTVEEGYEVKIPAEITVDPETKTGSYTVEAQNFVIPTNAYVTVTAAESGSLTNGVDNLAFTNALASGNLTKNGDKLTGKVTVSGDPTSAGEYVGTVDFTISYFAE